MKFYLSIITLCILLFSCDKPGKLTVTNKLSNVRITDVSWGNISIGSGLLPGKSTNVKTIKKSDVALPHQNHVYFVMEANSKTIYLKTIQTYALDKKEELTIEITSDTEVETVL